MTDTARLLMTLVEGADVISTDMRNKINAALNKLDTAAGYVLCTSTTNPTTNLFAGMLIFETDTKRRKVNVNGTTTGWRPIGGDTFDSMGFGMVRPIKPVRAFGQDSAHAAFPSVVQLNNGSLVMVYRQGTDHSASRDGVIKITTSTDQGRTWSAPTTALTGSPAGTDLRDPCVSLSRSGTKIYLTYFKGTSVLAAAGVFFRVSTDSGATWGTEVRVDNLPYAASSAPAIELDTGTIVVPYYGRLGAESWDSCWTNKSTDAGISFPSGNQVRIMNGTTATLHFQEPYVALKGQTAVMAFRYGQSASIGISSSTDNTVNWSAGASKFLGSGRPTVFWVTNESLVCVYRATNGDAVYRTSKDIGANWYPERLLDQKPSSAGWMTYAGADLLSGGAWFCVLSQETSSTLSRVFFTYMGEGGTNTPFGVIPTDAVAGAANLDTFFYSTNFEQNDGAALPSPWTIAAGAITVTNGEVASASADNVPDFIRVFVNANDMVVEADIYNGGVAPVQTGSAIVFRMINANSYLMFTPETVGANMRIYKVVSGTATALNTTAGALQPNTYNTYRVHVRDHGIWCFINDRLVCEVALSDPDYSTFSSGLYAGIKLNSQGTTTHKCRRFLVRS